MVGITLLSRSAKRPDNVPSAEFLFSVYIRTVAWFGLDPTLAVTDVQIFILRLSLYTHNCVCASLDVLCVSTADPTKDDRMNGLPEVVAIITKRAVRLFSEKSFSHDGRCHGSTPILTSKNEDLLRKSSFGIQFIGYNFLLTIPFNKFVTVLTDFSKYRIILAFQHQLVFGKLKCFCCFLICELISMNLENSTGRLKLEEKDGEIRLGI